MIDTHCHIYLDAFQEDLQQVLDRAAEAGVRHICMPAIDFDSPFAMRQMQHSDIAFHRMTGLHPCSVTDETVRQAETHLSAMAGSSEFVAIGETGLDYHWSDRYVSEQQFSLEMHCDTAKAVGKPVVLHNRKSTEDLLDKIEQQQDGRLNGVWHCFNGTVDQAKRALDLNLYLGVGGVVTFKNAGVDKAVAELPMDRLLLETDAPYLAPHPHRGERNEPAFMKKTAERLAEIKQVDLRQVDEQTTENAGRLFGLDVSEQAD